MKANLTFLQQAIGVLLLSISLGLSPAWAQMKVGQPAGSPDPSAALDVSGGPYTSGSQYRGIAPPKVALTKTSSAFPVDKPVTGLLVYNTANAGDVIPGYYYWEGSKWLRFTTASAGSARVSAAPGAGQYIPAYTINEVRALTTTPATIIVVDPGQEGIFSYDSSDTNTPDNIGTILVTTASSNLGKRYKRAYKGMIEVEWFGAKGIRSKTDDAFNLALAATNATAIQRACDWAALTSGQPNETFLLPNNKNRPAIVHIPSGTYYVSQTINLQGAIQIKGDGGMSFGGTELYATTAGAHLFSLTGAPYDGASNAVEIHDMRTFMAGSSTLSAVIYSGNPSPSSYHSLRVEGVWFQLTGQNQRVYIGKKADDVKFTNCTFDGTYATAFVLGTTDLTEKVSNFVITNCTGYNNHGGLISAINVDGLLFSNNRIYGTYHKDDDVLSGQIPFVIDALEGSQQVRGLQIVGNRFDRTNAILKTQFDQALVVGNHITRADSRVFEFGGSGAVKNCRFTDNIISGVWVKKVTLNGVAVDDAPISAYGGPISSSVFDNTIFDSTATSPVAYYLPNSLQANSIYTRNVSGFTLIANAPASSIINPDGQTMTNVAITGGNASLSTLAVTGLLTIPDGSFTTPGMYFAGTATGLYRGLTNNNELIIRGPVVTGKDKPSAVVTSLGRTDLSINSFNSTDLTTLNWAQAGINKWSAYIDGSQSWNLLRQGGPNPISITSAGNTTLSGNTTISNLTVSNAIALPTAFNAAQVNTNGWVVGSYTQIVPQATLEAGAAYLLKLQWHKTGGGVDDISQVYWLTTMGTNSNASTNADISPTDVASYGNTNYRVRIRRKVPVNSNNVTYGLEAAISDVALAVQGGYFTFTLTKF